MTSPEPVTSKERYVGQIMTVRGPIPPGLFGMALPHEHVLVDFIGADKTGRHRYDPDDVYRVMLPYLKEARAQGWTGSLLMVHGSCVSIGCYAMTDAGIEQIYTLVDAALAGGQDAVPVHAFPFRLDAAADARIEASPWRDFWRQLQAGHLAFEREGRPPAVGVRGGRYVVE